MADIREAVANSITANVNVPTTTETIAITSDPVVIPGDAVQVCVLAWGQLTTGAGTTTVTPRIRRGTLITDPLIGEANAENVKAAAGSTEPFLIMVVETLIVRDKIQYVFTLQQAAAAGAGTVLQASILVLVF